MRKFLLFLFVANITSNAHALMAKDVQNIIVDTSKNFETGAEQSSKKFAEIENQVKEMNPHLVNSLSSYDMRTRLSAYRSYLARTAFEDLKESFMADMRKESERTGHEIITISQDKQDKCSRISTKETIYKLDNNVTTINLPQYKMVAWEYPDDYEEYKISYKKNYSTGDEWLYISRDNIENDTSEYIVIHLENVMRVFGGTNEKVGADNMKSDEVLTRVSLSMTAHSVSYKEQMAYLRQLSIDIQNGMLQPAASCEGAHNCAELLDVVGDYSRWPSNSMMPFGIGMNATMMYNNQFISNTVEQ